MKKSKGRLNVATEVLLVIFLIAMGAQHAHAEFKGDKELLKLVALQYKANRQAIRTWQGNADWSVTTAMPKDGKLNTIKEVRAVKFAYDRAVGKSLFLAARKKVEAPRELPPGPERDVWGGLGTPDGYFRVSPWMGGDEKRNARSGSPYSRPSLMIGPPTKRKRGYFGEHFDPFWFTESSGLDIYDRLMGYYDHWGHQELGKINNISVSRNNNLVVFLYDRPGILHDRYVFDLDQGANLLERDTTESSLTTTTRREFAHIGGAWVPTTGYYRQTSIPGNETHECHVGLQEQKVNAPIPVDSFTLAKIGIKAGDTVNDTRTSTHFKYSPDTDLPEVPPSSQKSSFWVIAWILCAIGVLAFGFWLWRRSPKETTHAQPS